MVKRAFAGAYPVANPQYHVRGCKTLGAHLYDGGEQRVQRLLDEVVPLGGANVAVMRVGQVYDNKVHARGAQLGHVGTDNLHVGTGVIAQSGLCPVVELGIRTPASVSRFNFGDVVPTVDTAARNAQDGVKPDRIADGNQIGRAGDVKARTFIYVRRLGLGFGLGFGFWLGLGSSILGRCLCIRGHIGVLLGGLCVRCAADQHAKGQHGAKHAQE